MIKISSKNELDTMYLPPSLKDFLEQKIQIFLDEYSCNDITDTFAVILLDDDEIEYVTDKLLEFSEVINLDDEEYIHSVWASSDGYAEDIYMVYSEQSELVFKERC